MARPPMKEEWRGKSDKLIPLSDLSRILGKNSQFLWNKHYRKNPIGIMKLGRGLYVNLEFAKCLAQQYAIFSSKPIDEILQEIDDFWT